MVCFHPSTVLPEFNCFFLEVHRQLFPKHIRAAFQDGGMKHQQVLTIPQWTQEAQFTGSVQCDSQHRLALQPPPCQHSVHQPVWCRGRWARCRVRLPANSIPTMMQSQPCYSLHWHSINPAQKYYLGWAQQWIFLQYLKESHLVSNVSYFGIHCTL